MTIRKDKEFDVDGLVHKELNQTFYGTFRITSTVYMYKEDKKHNKKVKLTVGGITVIVKTERKYERK